MKKYKVLIAHNYYKFAGGEDTVVQNEKRLLEDNGHDVLTYFRKNEDINNRGILNKVKLFFQTIFSFKTYKEVKEIISKEKVDIVHVHNTLPLLSPSIYYAAFSCGVPVVQTIHNFRLLCANGIFYRNNSVCEDCINKGLRQSVKYKCYRNSYLQTFTIYCMLKFHRFIGTYNKVNAYITLTSFNKEKLKTLVTDSKKIYVKPNFMHEIEICARQRIIKDYFVYLGRLENVKGIRTLLEGWKKINSKLYIIGTGEEKEYVEQFLKENVNLNIEYLGFMKKEKAFKYLTNAKALVVPSKWYEGFPMTIVESFSLGVPVIASKLGNLSSIISHEKNGLLFDNESIEDFSTQVNKMNCDMELNKNLSVAAYDTYKELYTDKKNYEQLINIYMEVISR